VKINRSFAFLDGVYVLYLTFTLHVIICPANEEEEAELKGKVKVEMAKRFQLISL